MAILESCEQPNCSLSCNLPYLTAGDIPISHVSGQQLLVSILLIGGNITSMEMDTTAVSKRKITAFVPPGCMLPSCAVICQRILVLLLWSFLLISELLKQNLMPALKTSAWYRDRTEVPSLYIKKLEGVFLTRKLVSIWRSC